MNLSTVVALCAALALSVAAVPSTAADSAAKLAPSAGVQKAERGWFFFDDPKQLEEEPEPEPVLAAPKPLPRELPPPPKEDSCKKKQTWTPTCGFVNPGEDFEFQAKQRDALMERMVISQNNPKAVEDFQYYMRWALERTTEVSNLWYYNMVQNPELDPTATQPISTVGLRLMTDVRKGKEAEFTRVLNEEGAFLIFFSKNDCHFCHSMAPAVKELAEQLRIPVRNAALDNVCIAGLSEGCETAPRTIAAAKALQVGVVPTVFLYVPKNTFIRISTGVTSVSTMKARALQFFEGTRTALLKGVENGSGARPSVDFGTSGRETGTAVGVDKQDGPPRLPSEAEMGQLLGATSK